jgi:hypothetical protein
MKLSPKDKFRVRVNNEWMRRFIETPEAFAREWQSVVGFKEQEASGEEPDFGLRCVLYENKLSAELKARDVKAKKRKAARRR